MQVKEVKIKNIDLKKLMREKGIKSIKQLAKVAGVGETYLDKCANNYIVMGEETWRKLKRSL